VNPTTPTHEELRAALRIANEIVMHQRAPDETDVWQLAYALVRFGEATAHYERCITWEMTCMRCARTLDACYAADCRAEEAESALAVALAKRGPPSGVLTLLGVALWWSAWLAIWGAIGAHCCADYLAGWTATVDDDAAKQAADDYLAWRGCAEEASYCRRTGGVPTIADLLEDKP
jgi:hypothetical protein